MGCFTRPDGCARGSCSTEATYDKKRAVKVDNDHLACYACRKTYGKLALTRKETRKLAGADGWLVRVPGMANAGWHHPDGLACNR